MATSPWVVKELVVRAIVGSIAAQDTILRKTSESGGREYEAASLGGRLEWSGSSLNVVSNPEFDSIGVGTSADSNVGLSLSPSAINNEARCYYQGNGSIGLRMGFNDASTLDKAHFFTLNTKTYNPQTAAITQDSTSYVSLLNYWTSATADASAGWFWGKASAGATAWSAVMNLYANGLLRVYGTVRSDSPFNYNGNTGITADIEDTYGNVFHVTGGIVTSMT